MSNLLHPVSDEDTSVTQLVLSGWGPGAPVDTNAVLHHPIPSAVIDAWGIYEFQPENNEDFDDGLTFPASASPSDGHEAIDLHGLRDEFVPSSLASSYSSTFSSLSNAFGTEVQMPAHAPPSPNPSTSSTLPPSEHDSSSASTATSSSLCDALGQDWLSSPLQVPFSSPFTPESQQGELIAPTLPPTNTPLEMTSLQSQESGVDYPLPTVEFFFPRIEEKNDNNLISHHNGGNPICYYNFVVEQTDIDIRQRGERTATRKEPETRVESPISRKRKRDEDSETRVVKPKFKNQGRRSDLEGFTRPETDNGIDGVVKEVEKVAKQDVEKVVKKERKHRAVSDRSIREKERQEENDRRRAKKRRGATRA